MASWSELEGEQTRLEQIRQREEPIWRDLSRMLEEDGGDAFDVRQDASREYPDRVDSTPLYAKDDFVGGLFTEAMNPVERFFSFGLEDKDLEKWGPVAEWLWDAADKVFGTLDPASSNFYIEATPWLGDMAVFSSGFMGQEEDAATGRIIDRAIPLAECFKDVDADGELNRFHRKYQLNGAQAKAKWGSDRAPPTARDDETITFVQAVYRNPGYQPGKLGAPGMPWVSCHVSPDKRDWSIERGFHEMPVHEIQWRRRSSRAWGTGPGHKVLADMNMLDAMQHSIVTALQFDAEPMLLVHNEDIMTAADIIPSNTIYGGMNNQGKELVKTLERGNRLQLPMAAVQDVRNGIREGFHFSLMQVVNRPQMTLGEFMGWKEEKLRILAPHLVCIHRGLGSHIARRARILARQNRLPPMPPELQNQAIKIGFISPFATVQKAQKARNALNVANAAIAIKPLKEDVGDILNADNILRTISDGLSGDPTLQNDPRAVAQIRQARAQQTAPDVALMRGAQMAAIKADVAHADQATTSAKQRDGGKAA